MSTVRVSDLELVARAREGDAAAFGELVERHGSAVYRAALAVLGSAPDAEDAAQDAFIAAFRRLASFRGDSSFKTWLLAIAWRQAINQRRGVARWWRQVTKRGVDAADEDRCEIAGTDPSPEQTAAGRQLRQAIRGEIQALPVKLRDTLLLAQTGDWTYEEIAVIVGAPLGTVKWRVSEARRVIKARLRKRGHLDAAMD